MAQVASTELLTFQDRTVVNGVPTFSVDTYRCGKCSLEFNLLEDFICHKIVIEKNSMVFWDSEKISGIQIPRFIENVVAPKVKHKEISKNNDEEDVSAGLTDSQHSILQEPSEYEHYQQQFVHINRNQGDKIDHSSSAANTASLQKGKEIKQASNEGSSEPTKQQVAKAIAKQKLNKQDPECIICGSIYRDFTTLKTHLRTVHSKNRPFNCKFSSCSCTFKTKASLQRHERRHTGERPYNCEQCGRSFRESGTLSRHQKSRIPCFKKEELPRYGKTLALVSNDSKDFSEESACNKDTPPTETLQIIITPMVEPEVIMSKEQNVHQPQINNVSTLEVDKGAEIISHQFSQLLEVATRLQPQPLLTSADHFIQTHVVLDPPCVLDPERLHKALSQQLLDHNLQCIVCDHPFQQPLHLIQHLQHTHLQNFPFRCTKCFYVSKDKESLTIHNRTKHDRSAPPKVDWQDDRDWTQEAVMQLLILNDILDEQDQKNNGRPKSKRNNGSYRCHVCLKRFSGRGYFSLHMGSHTGELHHSCDICHRTFISKDALVKHTVSHSQQRSFKCDTCGKSFKRQNHIREHMRTHSNIKYYFCKICNRGFKWQGALKSHELTHSRGVVFVCDGCDRRFKSRNSLKRHARLHLQQQHLQESDPSVINNSRRKNVPSCDASASDMQLIEPGPEDQQTYFIIHEDGSLSLVSDSIVLETGLLDAANMWRQSSEVHQQDDG